MEVNSVRYLLIAGSVAVFTATALADVSLSSVEIDSTSPGMAVLSANVTGTGDVFAEYAHDKSKSFRSVKDRYVTDGLIAMWDAVDNMGTGSHVPDATTWRDLTGNHDDMNFTNSVPTIGANYYDMSKGGCGTPAEDIATVLNDGQCTVEIVCNIQSLIGDGTLFACVDGVSGTGAGTRFAWVRNSETYAIGACEHKLANYRQTTIDTEYGKFKSYVFKFNPSSESGYCVIVTNGVRAGKTPSGSENGNVANAWFSIGQRICVAGSSALSDACFHCVRVYNRTLTDDEIKANLAVDSERFKNPPLIDFSNPGKAVVERSLVGTVVGSGPNAKDCYETDGLIAMWDGECNQGVGESHASGVTNWVDLTGNHSDMVFTNIAPTIGANYYDVSAGGGFISDASDIAAALNAEACTIEIVCDPKSFASDGTLFACTDKDGTGKRMAWARMDADSVIGSMEYKSSGWHGASKFDNVLNQVRSYTFTYSDRCRVYKDGSSSEGKSVSNYNVNGDPDSAYFSVGQRISKTSQSSPIANIKIYCLRVYDRVLTHDEIASNHAADVSRFFSGESAELPASVKVVNSDGTLSFYEEGEKVGFRLTGLRPDLANYTARLFTTNATPSVTPSVTFESAAEYPAVASYGLPGLSLENTVLSGHSLTTELVRTGSEASDVYVVYGDRHGGATLDGWEHSEKLLVRFAAGDTSLSVTVRQPASAARYVRFFSNADGWSDSAYIPDTKAGAGLMIFVR